MIDKNEPIIAHWKSIGLEPDISLQDRVKRLVSLGYTYEHWKAFLNEDEGDDCKSYRFKTTIGKCARDELKDYLSIAHKNDLKVLTYLNAHWFASSCPHEWMMHTEEGKPKMAGYGKGFLTCINTPWREYFLQLIRDICKYEIDGIFLDGPNGGPCYCKFCREKFEKVVGAPLPMGITKASLLWSNAIEFWYESTASFLEDVRIAIDESGRDIMMYCNACGLHAGWSSGRNNRNAIKYMDLLGAEGGFIGYGKLSNMPIWRSAATSKLLRTQAGEKPAVNFMDFSFKRWDYYGLPATEIKIMYGDTISNGGNPFFAIWHDNIDLPAVKTAASMNKFLKRNWKYLHNTKSLAKTAIVWSTATADFYSASAAEGDFSGKVKSQKQAADYTKSFYGFYDSLAKSKRTFDVIDEYELEKATAKYDIIILPNIACMSDKTADAIRQFVQDGGTILASYHTSLFDEYGKRKDDFSLKDVFGINLESSLQPIRDIDFVSLNPEPLFEVLSQNILPSPQYCLDVKALHAKPIGMYVDKLPARYSLLPKGPYKKPFILSNIFGKGQAFYFSGTFGEDYWQFRFPEYSQIIHAIIDQAIEDHLVVETTSKNVAVNIEKSEKDNFIVVHIVNYGVTSRPADSICPINDLRIIFNGDLIVQSAKMLFANKVLKITETEEGQIINLDELQEYEAILLEF